MKMPRISTFPMHKPFEKQEPTIPLSEVALRLVVNFYSDAPQVVGTATVLSGNLLVTAKHVFKDILSKCPSPNDQAFEIDAHLVAIQILARPEPEYVIWNVFGGILCPVSDIALLQLATNPGRSHPDSTHQWVCPRVNPFAPEIGERVAAFGYRKSLVRISKNSDGGNHIDLDDEPMISVGIVKEIHEIQRDSALLPFPCYQVSARFDGGMSGGPVFDETGSLCGIVCSNVDGSHLDGEPVSYVTTLWPLFRLIISADRGDSYPRGVRYPVIELARGGQISVPDLPRLNRWFAERIDPNTLRLD